MGKFLILLSLLPVASYWLARRFFGDGVLAKYGSVDCRIAGVELAQKLGFRGRLPRRLRDGRTALAMAEISYLTAFEALIAERAPMVKWRQTVDVWGRLVVPFSLMIAAFGILAGRPPSLCIGLALALNGIVAIFKWTTWSVAKHVAQKAIVMMTQARIPRQEDEAAVEVCLRAWAWR